LKERRATWMRNECLSAPYDSCFDVARYPPRYLSPALMKYPRLLEEKGVKQRNRRTTTADACGEGAQRRYKKRIFFSVLYTKLETILQTTMSFSICWRSGLRMASWRQAAEEKTKSFCYTKRVTDIRALASPCRWGFCGCWRTRFHYRGDLGEACY
jgi:hypothetical protein